MQVLTPMGMLWSTKGKNITVHLRWGDVYEGVLCSNDEYMNVRLEKAVCNGIPVGDVVIRCTSLLYLYTKRV